MATAMTIHPSHLRQEPASFTSPQSQSHTPSQQSPVNRSPVCADALLRPQPLRANSAGSLNLKSTVSGILRPGRDGASCDACLKRNSRCAMNESVNKCYSCDFHRQDCTFTLSAQSRKRKVEETAADAEPVKRQPHEFPYSPSSGGVPEVCSRTCPTGTAASPTIPFQSCTHIGLTTEVEPLLLEHLPLDQNDESLLATGRVRKYSEDGTFMRVRETPQTMSDSQSISVDVIENLVAPHGPTLVEKFFQHVHPTFPILLEDSFRQSYTTRRGLSPLLLCAVYFVSLKWLDPGAQAAAKPDAGRLEATAVKLLTESLPHALVSTIQAGLLITQKSALYTSSLTAQLVTAGFELGLHQDCSTWKMEAWQKGLRNRLAWALYMQDKWSSLVHGRPSHIVAANWTVKALYDDDFIGAYSPERKSGDESRDLVGPMLFNHMVALTRILSDILDSFYTLKAAEDFNAAGDHKTKVILERAKPVQIRLKDWFARLPAELKMDAVDSNDEDMSQSNGALHLAYFATEITLHRCIVRSLSADMPDLYLSHICRSAAKTRLISAMDFVNRLRPMHLRSFWPSASRTNFALIGAFGVLLRASAPTKEEADFYSTRLGEFRWTLGVSCKNAEFLAFAIESLETATGLLENVPEKPEIEEFMARNGALVPRFPNPPRRSQQLQMRNISMMNEESMNESMGLPMGSGSAVSGLASPTTSVSSGGSVQDAFIPAYAIRESPDRYGD